MTWRLTLITLTAILMGCSEQSADTPAAAAREPDMSVQGELAFMRCRACHSTAAEESHKVGPNLHGFLSRPAGTAAGYVYSEELRAAGLTWDAGTLAAWITDPAFTVPGTTMVYPNDLAGDEIVALMSYLEQTTGAP